MADTAVQIDPVSGAAKGPKKPRRAYLVPKRQEGDDGLIKNDRQIVSKVKDLVEKSMRDRDARYLQLWLREVAFTKGVQWFTFDGLRNQWVLDIRVPRKTIRLTENRTGPTVDQMVAMTTTDPVRLACTPSTEDYDDINRAEVGTALLRKIRDDYLGLMKDDPRVKYWCFTTGMCAIDTFFDPEAGKFEPKMTQDEFTGEWVAETDEDGKVVFEPEGRLQKELYTAFQIVFDQNATGPDDAEWVALGTVMSKERAQQMFPEAHRLDSGGGAWGDDSDKRYSGISTNLSDTLRRAFSFVGPNASWFGSDLPMGTQPDRSGVEVWKFYMAPCRQEPGGRTIIVAGGELVYDDVSQTEGNFRFPCEVFYDFHDGKQAYGQGRVASLIPIQEELNVALSDLAMKRKINLNPRVMLPRDCMVPAESFTSNPREIIEYMPGMNGAKPEYLPAPGIHPAEWQYIVDKREAFDFISGINDAARGDNPAGVRSEKQLVFLKGQNTQRLGVVVKQHRIGYANIGRYALFLLGRYWPDGKTVSAIGKDYEPFMLEFKQSQFDEPFDVSVENGLTLPEDPVDRANALTAMFDQLAKMGPADRAYYLELMNVGDVRRLLEEGNRQQRYTRAKYLECLKGVPQRADYYEHAETGRRVLRDLMLSQEFLKQDEGIKSLVVALDTEYAMYTSGSVPVDGQGSPLPPGAYTPETLGRSAAAGPPAQPQGSPPAPAMAPR